MSQKRAKSLEEIKEQDHRSAFCFYSQGLVVTILGFGSYVGFLQILDFAIRVQKQLQRVHQWGRLPVCQ